MKGCLQELSWRDENLEEEVKKALRAVISIRRLKKTFNVSGKHKPAGEFAHSIILGKTTV